MSLLGEVPGRHSDETAAVQRDERRPERSARAAARRLAPLRFRAPLGLGEGRGERVRRVGEGAQPEVTEGLPLVGADATDLGHATSSG